jgi:hypothetical protein
MSSSAAASTPANSLSAPKTSETSTNSSTAAGLGIFGMVFSIIVLFVWHLGAASLSYAKYGSIGWAILDFFFASFYYPFYAFFLNTPSAPTGMMGGRRKLKFF